MRGSTVPVYLDLVVLFLRLGLPGSHTPRALSTPQTVQELDAFFRSHPTTSDRKSPTQGIVIYSQLSSAKTGMYEQEASSSSKTIVQCIHIYIGLLTGFP